MLLFWCSWLKGHSSEIEPNTTFVSNFVHLLQYRSKVSYHLSSHFSRDVSRFSRDASGFSRDESGFSRDESRFSRDESREKRDVSRDGGNLHLSGTVSIVMILQK